ncbi:hypothetical protein HYFRA_00003039 [Hymenoscyphus fraxineus]|uniref:Uncharacterized protein n=1 Tax=Hymenoscyphus fraxineus TaxID=746836 RepID=A0A9N9KPQ1_9HELO|nr:hypothetical protein HYFRA_00003039 [Hymenoscyphus fraxineus]
MAWKLIETRDGNKRTLDCLTKSTQRSFFSFNQVLSTSGERFPYVKLVEDMHPQSIGINAPDLHELNHERGESFAWEKANMNGEVVFDWTHDLTELESDERNMAVHHSSEGGGVSRVSPAAVTSKPAKIHRVRIRPVHDEPRHRLRNCPSLGQTSISSTTSGCTQEVDVTANACNALSPGFRMQEGQVIKSTGPDDTVSTAASHPNNPTPNRRQSTHGRSFLQGWPFPSKSIWTRRANKGKAGAGAGSSRPHHDLTRVMGLSMGTSMGTAYAQWYQVGACTDSIETPGRERGGERGGGVAV